MGQGRGVGWITQSNFKQSIYIYIYIYIYIGIDLEYFNE